MARPPKKRVASRCSNFNLLLVSALRTHRIRARLRCGYADYFNPRYFEDHWVCEYWDATASRWKMADAQFDAIWKRNLGIRHDVTDLPAGAFLNSAQAWQKCRAGDIDPNKVGIHFVGLYGLPVVAGSLIRDIAALARREMLPWDVWGAQPAPESDLTAAQLAYLDEIATLINCADDDLDAVAAMRVAVPTTHAGPV